MQMDRDATSAVVSRGRKRLRRAQSVKPHRRNVEQKIKKLGKEAENRAKACQHIACAIESETESKKAHNDRETTS